MAGFRVLLACACAGGAIAAGMTDADLGNLHEKPTYEILAKEEVHLDINADNMRAHPRRPNKPRFHRTKLA